MTATQRQKWIRRLEVVKSVLDITMQVGVLLILTLVAFLLLLTMNSCSSYPVLPQGEYGEEPVEEYFAVEPLESMPEDALPVTVTVGELRYAGYVYDAYYALLDVVNARGNLMEDMMLERDVLLENAIESQKTGKFNTVLGTGAGIAGGFLLGFTVFTYANLGR